MLCVRCSLKTKFVKLKPKSLVIAVQCSLLLLLFCNTSDSCCILGSFCSKVSLHLCFFVTTVPGYISRSVAGSYDNEGIAIFSLMFTYYLWVCLTAVPFYV